MVIEETSQPSSRRILASRAISSPLVLQIFIVLPPGIKDTATAAFRL
jgi:hypothetical protein